MQELKVLDLRITEDISLLLSSLQFLSNLLTLHLDYCQKFDNISVIGKLLNLEILSFRGSNIEKLPKDIGGLVNLKLLDLTRCRKLKRIAPGVISALVQLQELYMGGCGIIWKRENASLREFESLSNLNTLEIIIKDVVCLLRIPLVRKPLGLYPHGTCTITLESGGIISLFRSTAVLELMGKDSEDAVQELFREGVEGLQHLTELVIRNCATPECLVNTMEWVPRTPNAIPPILPILEKLKLRNLPNLRKIWHCQLPTGSFGKLKHLEIEDCDGMEEVIWKEKGVVNTMEWVPRTLNAIPPIFPILEKLKLRNLPNLRKIWHCQLPTGSFGKLKHLEIENCDRMEEVIWKEKGEDEATSKMEFPALESVILKSLPMLIGFCRWTDEIEFPQLKKLHLEYLPQLKWVFLNSSNPFSELMENHNATFLSLFPDMVALKELLISGVPNITEIWGKQFPSERKVNNGPSLESLVLCNLPNLRKIWGKHFQLPTGSFRNLKHLEIENCDRMDEVTWKEKGEDEATSKMEFPALESMILKSLPMLIGFCRGTDEIEFPRLKKLHLEYLPQLKWLFLNSNNPFSESMENHNPTFLSLFPDKVAFPTLEELLIFGVPNITKIWGKQFPCERKVNCFEKLMNAVQSNNSKVKAMAQEKKRNDDVIAFPQLRTMRLDNLRNFETFCWTSSSKKQTLFNHQVQIS
ncbi:hypothetical protein TEA_026119 [Camellia sinensis var. sinensis]|uniref:Disease resistance protein At4g27190-like leucine-rich repeats domain-containing protein n=1 Tax=Camellia sinensis var. sinensis TaxID=542762 RepID=A0A4V3WM29_CAMSN|nr:hypothetical protein TEA_026119 [Camellia sinensis var. sinensis]